MPKTYESENGVDYVAWDDVPVFKEHTDEDGYKYGAKELAQVAKNNNKRIEQTGDYAPIVAWHTPNDGDRTKSPPIIGYAGPFNVAKMPNEDKWGITAKMRFFKSAEKYAMEHPRRSVEIWAPPKDPNGRFIDPIAVLGHETPRLDLGLLTQYERSESDAKVYHYEMPAAPGGGNTFIAGEVDGDRKPKKYEVDGMDMTPEVIGQLTELIGQVVDERLQAAGVVDDAAAVEGVEDAALVGDTAPIEEEGIDDMAGEEAIVDEAAEVDVPMEEEDELLGKEMFQRACGQYGMEGDMEKADYMGAHHYMMAQTEESRRKIEGFIQKSGTEAQKKIYQRIRATVPKSMETAKAEASVMQYQREAESFKKKYEAMKASYQKVVSQNVELNNENATNRLNARKHKYSALLEEKSSEGICFDKQEQLDFVLGLDDEAAMQHIESNVSQFPKVPTQNIVPMEHTPAITSTDESKKYSRLAGKHVNTLRQQHIAKGGRHDEVTYKNVLDTMIASKNEGCPTLDQVLGS